MKIWFTSLPLREQRLLIAGAIALFALILLSTSLNMHETKERNEKRLAGGIETLTWVKGAVATIKSSSGGGVARQMRNKSLIQISELASARSGIRSTRFQPSGENDAQIWFEEVPFTALMQYISRMEQDGGVNIESVSMNAAKIKGLVNARIKFSK